MFQEAGALATFVTPLWAFDMAPRDAEPINRELYQFVDEWLTPRPEVRPGDNW